MRIKMFNNIIVLSRHSYNVLFLSWLCYNKNQFYKEYIDYIH